MTISPELLAAYADGELSELEAAPVRRAVESDPELAARLAQLRSLRELLAARYDPILEEPVPGSLQDPIASAAHVVDLGTVRAARQRWFQRPALRYAIGPAIAAGLVLALFVGRGPGTNDTYAEPQLAALLDSALSGEAGGDGSRVLLSFRNTAGDACRAWAGPARSGIACHDRSGWKVVKSGPGAADASGQFRQAGSAEAAIMAAAQDMAAGPALNHNEEAAARGAGWPRADQAPASR